MIGIAFPLTEAARARAGQEDLTAPQTEGCVVVAYPVGPDTMKDKRFTSWEAGLDFGGKLGTGYVIFDTVTGAWLIREQA
jgi:hypothetical protein